MSKKRVYLDSCILVAYWKENDTGTQHQDVLQFVEKAQERADCEFYISSWGLTEALKVMHVSASTTQKEILKLSEDLMRKSRIGNLKLNWIRSSDKKDYDLDEFFYEFQELIFRYRVGVGDLMHLVLMGKFDVPNIVTFNTADFDKFNEYKVVTPKNIFRSKLK